MDNNEEKTAHEEMDDLQFSANSLMTEVQGLRSDLETTERSRKRAVVAIIICFILVISALGFGGYTLNRFNRIAQENHDALILLRDATDPNGSIYKQSLENQNDAIFQLICDNHRLHGETNPVIGGVPCQ